jgi:hypothetical protein
MKGRTMSWIRTVSPEHDPSVGEAMARQRALYPPEYARPVQELDQGLPGIVASHTLIPDALYHAFATFGALMSPELPLGRRQHEMIATMVSVTNKCRY